MARRQGLLRFSVITQTHGSSEWVRRHNLALPDLGNLETEALERNQIELSDHVLSPSSYMLNWYRTNGVRLPERTSVLNWFLPGWSVADGKESPLQTAGLAAGILQEIIFFGRHERRKGLEIFIEAIRQMKPRLPLTVTFLGRFDRIERENSVGYVLRNLRDFPGRLRFLSDYDQDRALRYIQSRSAALCVLPSLIENSPCTVGEAFSLGVPFIASSAGGTAELIEPAHREIALFPPEPRALVQRLDKIYHAGLPRVSSTLLPAVIAKAWRQVHEPPGPTKSQGSVTIRSDSSASGPLVSVCLIHFERPKLLLRALEHLLQQTYQNIEIVIVDDGSESATAAAALDDIEGRYKSNRFSVIRSPNRYLGAARNLAARYGTRRLFPVPRR